MLFHIQAELHASAWTRTDDTDPQFNSDVIKPMNLEPIMDQDVQTLSGGELQRVAICLVLGVPADVLLIDEPSAYLDSEQRIHASKVIKKFVMGSKRTAFVVEHDFVCHLPFHHWVWHVLD